MTQPYAPRTGGTFDTTTPRHTGQLATASSANQPVDILAHLSAYITPIAALRPSERASVELTEPPTHGTWSGGEAPLSRHRGIGTPSQHGRAVVSASPVVVGSVEVPTADGQILAPVVVAGRPDDPGDVLDPVALSALYPDFGVFGYGTRDLSQRLPDVEPATATVVATGTPCVTTIDFDEAAPLVYLPTVTVYGMTSQASASPGALDWDEWPAASPILGPMLAPGLPQVARMLTHAVRAIGALDRSVYARAGAVLTSSYPPTSYETTSTTEWAWLVRGLFHELPGDRLPGSSNITGAGSGSAAWSRGALTARVWIARASVRVGVRLVTVAGSHGQSSTFGSWVWATATETGGTVTAHDVEVLLPDGAEPGDMYEIGIAWLATSDTAACDGWIVYEGALEEVHVAAPISIEYADRATLLAATPETGSTGYVPSYAAATEVWRRTGSGWSVVAAVITDWDDRPTASDGGVMQWNAATYIGDATVGEWVAAECAQHTRTLLDTIIGTESSAQLTSDGWTVATSNGGTVGTVNESSRDWVKFDTSAGNSATANVSRSLTSGDGIYMVGWCKCSTSTGSAGAHGMAPYIRDGSRVYDFEADRAGPGARWVNGTTVAGAICDTDSLRGSAQVLEIYKRPNGDGGGAWARIDGGEWTQVVGLTQCATTASVDIYLGDSSGVGSTSTQWSETKIVRLT